MDLNVVLRMVGAYALVVVVHRHAQHFLRPFLSDHVLFQLVVDVLGTKPLHIGNHGALRLGWAFLCDDLVAEEYAFVADEHAVVSRDKPLDLSLRLAAERA